MGRIALNHLCNAVENHIQTRRQIVAQQMRGGDGAAGHIAQLTAGAVDHTKTDTLQAWVYTQNTHKLCHGSATIGIRAKIVEARSFK